ncbi:L-lactate MFS transporter [Alkalicoccus saliphilus]|uniref:MFS transporter n=1 Tax=Alkalicoccus saliphilus TaxID=200989 RepID=A0A2T4U2D3_9BACI|nr:OFA family MFS transporter [Alkalicoccus saliphilus]PTL37554.1 MFS transporter [Alkalicoccus saliphilus]
MKNRWLIALSAIAIHLSIGAAYAYSVYTNPINEAMGWSTTQITIAFTIMMALAGLSAAFFGSFVERQGPKRSAFYAAVLFSAGQIGAGVSVAVDSVWLFLLTYGFLSGLGLGFGYIAPVSTLVKWFPDRRGLATGMAVMGFGMGALITAPIAANLMGTIGISSTFYVLGIAYFILMILGAAYIAPPPEGWMPPGMQDDIDSGKKVVKRDLSQMTAAQAVRTRRFWLLWTMMLINTSAGIMMISVASPMAQETVGMTAAAAGTMVGIMGIINGGSRLAWAAVSDYLGRSNVFMIFFVVQVVAFLSFPNITSVILFQLFIFIVVSCYGGGFSNLPAFVGDLFGTMRLGQIHGYLLTTWSLGGIIGPQIVTQVYARTGSYIPVFYIFLSLMALALICTLLIKADIRKTEAARLNQENEQEEFQNTAAVSER